MKVLAIIPKTETEPAKFVVEATETELDKVSGIATTAHIAGRIKVGHEINVAAVYSKLEYFVKNKTQLIQAVVTLRDTADSVETLLPES